MEIVECFASKQLTRSLVAYVNSHWFTNFDLLLSVTQEKLLSWQMGIFVLYLEMWTPWAAELQNPQLPAYVTSNNEVSSIFEALF